MSDALHKAYQGIENKLRQSRQWQEDPLPGQTNHLSHQELLQKLIAEQAEEKAGVRQRLWDEYFACGPLQPLLEDPSINEIMVNSYNNIWIERRGKISEWEKNFLSERSLHNFIQRLLEESGKTIDLQRPFVDGQWRNFRVHLIIPPITQGEAKMTLRRHKSEVWNLEQLIHGGWADAKHVDFLRSAVQQKKNLLIVGPTSTGKTSCLNALIQSLPSEERVLIIEDASEIQPPNRASVKLLTRSSFDSGLPAVDQNDLIKQALRMNPDRVILGEVRGGEAKDLLLALSTGHQGSLCTLHAHDPSQALWRLEMLGQMGAPHWSLNTIRRLIQSSVDHIVCLEKTRQGTRKLKGIHQIVSLEDHGFLIESCF